MSEVLAMRRDVQFHAPSWQRNQSSRIAEAQLYQLKTRNIVETNVIIITDKGQLA